ncbi:uncharacterized protein LOC120219304 [Hibiscus syriacus]|uniref:uncharacterized protein LOC120219304 n=1 Tax=Hibiscus syriacus TaxID=106335 RepID=UPI00192292BE|nr:uncharacterized protein LOC120219304 [Hibiscus syriacus]
MSKARSSKHKKKGRRHVKAKCRVELKGEMEDIRKEQKSIKEAQSQIGEKLRAMGMECEVLQEEIQLMIQRSASTQIRLCLMFNIIKAREEGDFDKAAHMTILLREKIATDDM